VHEKKNTGKKNDPAHWLSQNLQSVTSKAFNAADVPTESDFPSDSLKDGMVSAVAVKSLFTHHYCFYDEKFCFNNCFP